jgi:hypothetical protein
MSAHCEVAIFIHKHKSHSYIRIITIKPFLNHGYYYIITVCHPKQILGEKSPFFLKANLLTIQNKSTLFHKFKNSSIAILSLITDFSEIFKTSSKTLSTKEFVYLLVASENNLSTKRDIRRTKPTYLKRTVLFLLLSIRTAALGVSHNHHPLHFQSSSHYVSQPIPFLTSWL